MGIQVVYVPIGVGTYHMETAADLFNRSAAALKKISGDVVVPEKVLLTVDEVASYLTGKDPDLSRTRLTPVKCSGGSTARSHCGRSGSP